MWEYIFRLCKSLKSRVIGGEVLLNRWKTPWNRNRAGPNGRCDLSRRGTRKGNNRTRANRWTESIEEGLESERSVGRRSFLIHNSGSVKIGWLTRSALNLWHFVRRELNGTFREESQPSCGNSNQSYASKTIVPDLFAFVLEKKTCDRAVINTFVHWTCSLIYHGKPLMFHFLLQGKFLTDYTLGNVAFYTESRAKHCRTVQVHLVISLDNFFNYRRGCNTLRRKNFRTVILYYSKRIQKTRLNSWGLPISNSIKINCPIEKLMTVKIARVNGMPAPN